MYLFLQSTRVDRLDAEISRQRRDFAQILQLVMLIRTILFAVCVQAILAQGHFCSNFSLLTREERGFCVCLRVLGGLFSGFPPLPPPGFSSETTTLVQACRSHVAAPGLQLALLSFSPSLSTMMTPTVSLLRHHDARCHEPALRSALVHIPCCNYSTHRPCVDDGVEAMCPYCSMDLRAALGRGVHLQCPLCGDSCCEDFDTVMFSCCPGVAFHVSCMATVVPGGREVTSCPMCPESVRDHVSVEWFQRLCHISGVPWPKLQPSSVPVECTLCADAMSDDTSVQVPCCQQHLHVSCLVRSFTSCGFHCPFCNQSLSDFARSGSFQVAVILQGCAMDMDAEPSNQGSISLVIPDGFSAPPAGYVFLCCPHVGPYPDFGQLQDRRMEWSPLMVSDAWSPQW